MITAPKSIANPQGFTMIEMMMASILLVLGLLAFGSFLGNVENKNARSEDRTQATTLAQDKLEELRQSSINAKLTTTTGADTVGKYSRSWNIDASTSTLANVTVTVTWSGTGTSSVSLQSLIYQ